MSTIFVTKVEADHFLVRVSPDCPYLIGKWLISIAMPWAMFPHRTTQLCVVDDFGNLVAVSS